MLVKQRDWIRKSLSRRCNTSLDTIDRKWPPRVPCSTLQICVQAWKFPPFFFLLLGRNLPGIILCKPFRGLLRITNELWGLGSWNHHLDAVLRDRKNTRWKWIGKEWRYYYTIFMNLHDAQDRTNYIISFENREQLWQSYHFHIFPSCFLQDSFVSSTKSTSIRALITLDSADCSKSKKRRAKKIAFAAIQLHLTRVKLLLAGLIEGFIACLRSLCILTDSF